MANDLTFNQIATIMNAVVAQATGKTNIAVTNTSDFVSVANTALLTGYDNVMASISQVLARTIFSVRPYSRKFPGIYMSNQRFGNQTRKLQVADSDWENDQRIPLVDGQSIDHWVIKKPSVLQTNFYGQNAFQRHITIFKDQLDTAFSSADEFGRFVSMVMQNVSDQIEQAHENMARACIANFIGGKIAGDGTNVIHLLSEYKDYTGNEALTEATVRQPENYIPFIQWMYGRLKTLSQLMTERSQKFHINVTDKAISRHTPVQRQKFYLYADAFNQIESSALSGIYNDKYLRMADHETVNFWQSIETPMGINVKPSFLAPDGTVSTPSAAVTQSHVLGMIFDEDALGITTINQWSQSTPMNAAGGYYNVYWHFTDRYYNDFTENSIVLLMD